MTSKMFIGSMPELTENILNNLNNEFYSLYSCALVSRLWCKISIPILWQDPFSFKQNSFFITQYISSLDENEKIILKECRINVKFPNTLFDYASFLKFLNLFRLENKVEEWIDLQKYCSSNLSYKSYKSLKYRIVNSLFKLFVESGATLHQLHLHFSDYEINSEIFYSLERNVRFFSRLQDLSLVTKTDLHTENVTALLKILAKNAIKISALKLDGFYSDYEPQLFHALICIIKSQEQLRKFSIVGGKFLEDFPKEYHGVISALESQNKSLREVTIMRCTCSAEFKVLMNCKNLEILRINDCDDVDILEANINTLELTSYMIDASSIVQILKKSGTLLQRLSLFSTDEPTWEISLLLETIKSFCPNITYLNISDVEFSTQFLEIIGNLRKLQYLTLCDIFEILDDEPEILVMQFAKLLPLTLQYLDLRYTCLSSYIDRLLNNCYAPLKYLLIDRLDDKKKAKALIEFCIRKGSLKYVGVEKRLNLDDNIKKEVEGCVTLISCERIVVNC